MVDVDGLAGRSLSLDGARALVSDADVAVGAAVARALVRCGASVHAEGVDAGRADRGACRQIVDGAVARLGGIDLLVNCVVTHASESDGADAAAAYDRRVHGPLRRLFFLTQAVHGVMRGRGGVVIHVAPGVSGMPGVSSANAAVRAGLAQLTKTMAVEWAEDRIRVNCVLAGPGDDRVEDVAAFVVALASDAGSHVSGESIRVDGGATAGGSWDRP